MSRYMSKSNEAVRIIQQLSMLLEHSHTQSLPCISHCDVSVHKQWTKGRVVIEGSWNARDMLLTLDA